MLRSYPIIIVSLAGLLGACSLSVEGFEYRPGAGGAAGSGGADAGAGGGGGSMSGSSSSANTGSEDCFDDIDTDGDGAVDCADTDCEAVAACGAVPKGWTLVRVSDAKPGDTPGKCDDSSTAALYFKDPAGAPTCAPCDCSPPQQASCTTPEMLCTFENNTCNGGDGFKTNPVMAQCIELSNNAISGIDIPNGQHSEGSCKITAPGKVVSPGTCVASGGEVMPSPMWGAAVLVCPEAADAAGCGAGQVCLPKPAGSVCITRAGNEPCPPEWPVATTVFADGEDARGCSGCSCKVGCSGGEFVVHDTPACKDYDPPVTVNSENCVVVPNIFDYDDTSVTSKAATPFVEACEGGEASGQVNPMGEQRICCLQ